MKTSSLIDDPTLASRYLADQLSESERAEYEARMLEDPAIVAELEATARLKIGLQRLRRTGELRQLMASMSGPPQLKTGILAMAATLAAVVIGASIWFPHSPASGAPLLASAAVGLTDRSGHSLSVISTTPLFRTRAERFDAVIDLPPTRGAIRLRVLPSAPDESTRYEASLARIRDDDSPEPSAAVGNLKPSSEDGFVDVYTDSALLTPGRYRLTLTRQSAADAGAGSETFTIKVNGNH